MSAMHSPIILALDHETDTQVLSFVKPLSPAQCRLKIGKYLFVRYGPDLVKQLIDRGFDVFLDLKFHDIPHTVRQACQAAAELGVWMLNVHCQGGNAMLHAAVEGVDSAQTERRPLLTGVTALTSLSEHDIASLGYHESVDSLVARYARMAHHAGLDGIVCSAREAQRLRGLLPVSFALVTPGIRLQSDDCQDQQRVQTPQQAIMNGANYLVIGRPITQSVDPMASLELYLEALSSV
ncbi:MAG: orotidine-5'-phosphate decarboxylase [Legionellales bacterium]|nr:orotidine-5'-phosphate decarboxylase [Legionellales bacterium]HAG61728.1 orotidine-5'-phosphate decarboxylase [Coxiellaceae bacterium]